LTAAVGFSEDLKFEFGSKLWYNYYRKREKILSQISVKRSKSMSVPNQKIVQIAPRTKRDADHLFATMNIDAL
jgi:hypothetical protein